jgi:serine/threonine protein phosphatase PrpC
VNERDIIILFSDGVSDNVHSGELASCVSEGMMMFGSPEADKINS